MGAAGLPACAEADPQSEPPGWTCTPTLVSSPAAPAGTTPQTTNTFVCLSQPLFSAAGGGEGGRTTPGWVAGPCASIGVRSLAQGHHGRCPATSTPSNLCNQGLKQQASPPLPSPAQPPHTELLQIHFQSPRVQDEASVCCEMHSG